MPRASSPPTKRTPPSKNQPGSVKSVPNARSVSDEEADEDRASIRSAPTCPRTIIRSTSRRQIVPELMQENDSQTFNKNETNGGDGKGVHKSIQNLRRKGAFKESMESIVQDLNLTDPVHERPQNSGKENGGQSEVVTPTDTVQATLAMPQVADARTSMLSIRDQLVSRSRSQLVMQQEIQNLPLSTLARMELEYRHSHMNLNANGQQSSFGKSSKDQEEHHEPTKTSFENPRTDAHLSPSQSNLNSPNASPDSRRKNSAFTALVSALVNQPPNPDQPLGIIPIQPNADVNTLASLRQWRKQAAKKRDKIVNGLIEKQYTEIPRPAIRMVYETALPILETMAQLYASEVGERSEMAVACRRRRDEVRVRGAYFVNSALENDE